MARELNASRRQLENMVKSYAAFMRGMGYGGVILDPEKAAFLGGAVRQDLDRLKRLERGSVRYWWRKLKSKFQRQEQDHGEG